MANINIANLKAPTAPNLPIAPTTYDQIYLNVLTNSLRLYFNQLDLLNRTVVTPDIGKYFNLPFIAALDDTVQSAVAPATAYPISFSTPYLPNPPNQTIQAPYIDPMDSTKFVIPDSHYYNYNYTLNFVKTTTGPATVAVWFRLNSLNYGVIDFPGSTRYYVVLGDSAPLTASTSIVLDEENGDSMQLMWTTSDIDVVLTPTPGGVIGPEPTGASAIMSITFVSA